MATIHTAAHTTITHIGMYRIGKVDGCGPFRQRDQIALGREAEHLIMEQFKLGMLQKLLRTIAFRKHFDEMAQPTIGVGFRCLHPHTLGSFLGLGVLINTMRRHPALSDFMHELRADLQFHAHPVRANDGGVDRAVIILLGVGDVILETPRHHPPCLMHNAQRPVTFVHLAHHHAEAKNIR